MFRGALLGHLRARFGWLDFSADRQLDFRGDSSAGMGGEFRFWGSIAMVLSAMREWRGSLVASMTGACD